MPRRILALLGLVAMLAACAGQPAAQPTSAPTDAPTGAPTESPATATPAATAVATALPTLAPAEPTPAVVEAACPEGFRFFDHELLESEPGCIPNNLQRIVALDIASVEVVLLSQKELLGTGQWMLEELPLLIPAYAETLARAEGLGYPAELEKVTLLKPDIILAPSDTIDVGLASDIAPTIVPKAVIYSDWKLGMQFWSAVLNVPDLYAQMEANYAERVAELQQALGDPSALKVSVISTSTYGVSLWMPDTSPGAILRDVGLARPESQSLVGEAAMARYNAEQYIPVSEERLDLVDGDAIFYFTYAATDPEVASKESAHIAAFEQKPLWQSLSAVKANKAFFVAGHWWRSQSYLLANKVIDDLFIHLAGRSATTPVTVGQP
ncbi:MAG: iron-siderophore ABC transporter substrate-binding protein [Roseiflexaceae bacterium]